MLTDFIVECTISDETFIPQQELTKKGTPSLSRPWILHVDGSSTPFTSGTGVILTSLTGKVVKYALRFTFPASNKEAEYEALLTGLKLAAELGASEL